MKWNIENILINIQATLKEMKETFSAGVNTIYDAIVARDVTPVSKSPADMAAAIAEISGSDLIPVVIGGVLQSGFEWNPVGGCTYTEEDGYIDIETHVGTLSVACNANAAFAVIESINAQYGALKIGTNPSFSSATNNNSQQALTVGNPQWVSVGSVGNNETYVFISGGASGHFKLYDLYIYQWEVENNG